MRQPTISEVILATSSYVTNHIIHTRVKNTIKKNTLVLRLQKLLAESVQCICITVSSQLS